MNKTFTFLIAIVAICLTGCGNGPLPISDLHIVTVEYRTTISSTVTFYPYFLGPGEQQIAVYGQPITGSTWYEQITVQRYNFNKAQMTLYIQGTPPFQVTSQILVNGEVKKTLNSTCKNYVDTVSLADPNVWSN